MMSLDIDLTKYDVGWCTHSKLKENIAKGFTRIVGAVPNNDFTVTFIIVREKKKNQPYR